MVQSSKECLKGGETNRKREVLYGFFILNLGDFSSSLIHFLGLLLDTFYF